MLVCDGRLCFIAGPRNHLRPKITGIPVDRIFICPSTLPGRPPVATYVPPLQGVAKPKSRRWWGAILLGWLWGDPVAPRSPRPDRHCIYELDAFRDADRPTEIPTREVGK